MSHATHIPAYDNVLSYKMAFLNIHLFKKIQVGKDQEKAQSEKDYHSKNRGGKKLNQQSGSMKTYRKPNKQLFSQ